MKVTWKEGCVPRTMVLMLMWRYSVSMSMAVVMMMMHRVVCRNFDLCHAIPLFVSPCLYA